MTLGLEVYERVKKVVDTLPRTAYGFWLLADCKRKTFVESIVDAGGLMCLKESLDRECALILIFQKKVAAEQRYVERIKRAISVPQKEIEEKILQKTFNVFHRMGGDSILRDTAGKENFTRSVVDTLLKYDIMLTDRFTNTVFGIIMRSKGKQSIQERARYVAEELQKLVVSDNEKDVYVK